MNNQLAKNFVTQSAAFYFRTPLQKNSGYGPVYRDTPVQSFQYYNIHVLQLTKRKSWSSGLTQEAPDLATITSREENLC